MSIIGNQFRFMLGHATIKTIHLVRRLIEGKGDEFAYGVH